ncbi:MAG: shikimate dehydrogenase [Polyangia bacterium]|jgi:shikimate dehydrogenase
MSRIDASFEVCALFGLPARHSVGPALHNAAFEALNLPLVYVAHEVESARLAEAFAGARSMGYRGLSITMPHKVAALALVDDIDDTAGAIGCINTVVMKDGRLRGANVDGLGALGALRQAGADPAGRRVLLLGSGGAARALAITIGLHAKPAELLILGAIEDELARLAHDVVERTGCPVSADLLTDASLAAGLGKAQILLHCTPVGMKPDSERSLVPREGLRSDLVVFDAVYNPRWTLLLRHAAAAGCRVIEGTEMFLGQAALQFEMWTGRPAPTDIMRRVLDARL